MTNQDTKKEPKYNITLTPELEENLSYCAGRLDMPRAEVFRKAVAFYRKSLENGQVK